MEKGRSERFFVTRKLWGREEMIARLEGALAASISVMLVGPPGVGKSSLARHIEGARDPGETVWVDARGCEGAEDLSRALLAALGGGFESIPSSDVLCTMLEERDVSLLVLDNVDAVTSQTSELARSLHERLPSLHQLATSRRREDTFFELLECPPLDTEGLDSPAVGLLRARHEEHRRGSSVGDEPSGEVLQELATQLDGLPLAIELCAPRLATLGARGLRERLDERLLMFNEAVAKRVGVSHSLLASLELSWEALSEHARYTLACCSYFTHSLGAEELLVVAGAERRVATLDAIDELLDHSLLVSLADGRFSLLESVRLFAAQKREEVFDADGLARVQQRFFACFDDLGFALASQIEIHDRPLARLRAEVENLRAVIQQTSETPGRCGAIAAHALSLRRLGGVYDVRPHLQGLKDARAALTADNIDRFCLAAMIVMEVRWKASPSMAVMDDALEDVRAARACSERSSWALALEADLRHRYILVEAPVPEEIRDFEELATLAEPWPHVRSLIMFEGELARVDLGVSEGAEDGLAPVARTFEQLDMPLRRATALAQSALAELRHGRVTSAISYLDHAIALAGELGHDTLRARALSLRAMVSSGRASREARREDMRWALKSVRLRGDLMSEAGISAQLALLHAEEKNHAACYRRFVRAATLYELLNSTMRVQLETSLAMCEWLLGDRESAIARVEQRSAQWLRGEIEDESEVKAKAGLAVWAVHALVARQRGEQTPEVLAALRDAFAGDTPERILAEGRSSERLALFVCEILDEVSEEEESEVLSGTWEWLASDRSGLGADMLLVVRVIWELLRPPERELCARVFFEAQGRRAVILTETLEQIRWPAGKAHDLSRRPVSQRLLGRLLEGLEQEPGEVLHALTVAEAIWPDEMMTPEVLTNRLYNAVSQLRKLGFKELLSSNREGYWLEPSLVILGESLEEAPL